MLKIERQQRIKELILFKQNMKISELSQELGVSEMTIHRDIKPLIEEGIILKTFGGIKLVPKNKDRDLEDGQCVLCGRNVQDRFSFRLFLRGNRMETACCPHCGILRYEQVEQEALQLICHDFLAETTINAKTAWYVWETVLQIGCCRPQILIFEQKEHAVRFVKGFDGTLLTFHKARKKININEYQG